MRQAQCLQRPLLALLLLLGLATGGTAAAAAPVYKTRTNVDTVPSGAQMYLVEGTVETFQGVTPLKLFRLPRGTIQLKFKKEGYDDLLQTVEIKTSNPSGATVTVNGAPKGVTPTVVEQLPAGPYLVEVSLTDFQKASQTINVEPGKRAIFDAHLQKVKGDTGDIKVLADVDDATVYLDGESIGKAPITQGGVKPGTHQIEARSPRGLYAEQAAEVKAGELTVVRLKMVAMAPPDKGSVRVVSTAPDSEASLDDGEWKKLPTAFNEVDPGSHVLRVRATGFAPWTKTITIERGASQEIVAELGQAGRVEVTTRDGRRADLFLNGKPLGKTPFVGEVPAGTHTLLVQGEDGKQEEFQIAVGVDRVVKVNAAFGTDKPKPVEMHRPMPFSARAISPGKGHASAIVSWPQWQFPLIVQAGGGLGLGMDINVQVRTAFDVINELELIYKWTFVDAKTAAASIELGIGGGLGGNDRNSLFARPVIKGSLMISEKAAITARAGFFFHSDRVGPATVERTKDRDTGMQLYLGLNVEFMVTEAINLMLSLEGDPMSKSRRLYEESFLDDPDPKLYFAGGLSFMF